MAALDLCVSANQSDEARLAVVDTLIHLGYDGVAWDTLVTHRLTREDSCAVPPVNLDGLQLYPFVLAVGPCFG